VQKPSHKLQPDIAAIAEIMKLWHSARHCSLSCNNIIIILNYIIMDYQDWIITNESVFLTIYAMFLFFVLIPGNIIRLPLGGSKMTVGITHAILFGLIWHFTHHFIWVLGLSSNVKK
jgi:hypothetical protein